MFSCQTVNLPQMKDETYLLPSCTSSWTTAAHQSTERQLLPTQILTCFTCFALSPAWADTIGLVTYFHKVVIMSVDFSQYLQSSLAAARSLQQQDNQWDYV